MKKGLFFILILLTGLFACKEATVTPEPCDPIIIISECDEVTTDSTALDTRLGEPQRHKLSKNFWVRCGKHDKSDVHMRVGNYYNIKVDEFSDVVPADTWQVYQYENLIGGNSYYFIQRDNINPVTLHIPYLDLWYGVCDGYITPK